MGMRLDRKGDKGHTGGGEAEWTSEQMKERFSPILFARKCHRMERPVSRSVSCSISAAGTPASFRPSLLPLELKAFPDSFLSASSYVRFLAKGEDSERNSGSGMRAAKASPPTPPALL